MLPAVGTTQQGSVGWTVFPLAGTLVPEDVNLKRFIETVLNYEIIIDNEDEILKLNADLEKIK